MVASSGSATFQGKKQKYTIALYVPDAVANAIGFSRSGVALSSASPTTIRFNERVVLTDVSIVTGATATGLFWLSNGALIDGSTLATATHLSTLANRPSPNIGFEAGSIISATNF